MTRDEYRAHIREVVDEAPPLSDEQRAALRALFNAPAAESSEAAPVVGTARTRIHKDTSEHDSTHLRIAG
jgi:hypothetical protein